MVNKTHQYQNKKKINLSISELGKLESYGGT